MTCFLHWVKKSFSRSQTHAEASLQLTAEQNATLEGLQAEIAGLEQALKAARRELYRLNTLYASQHFSLQASMQAEKIERLRNIGVASSVETLEGQKAQLTERVAALRAHLPREFPNSRPE